MDKIIASAKDRILQIPEIEGISKEKFFEDLGLKYSNFKGAAKNSSLSADSVSKILSKYPNINPDWLISGIGNIYRSQKNDQGENFANKGLVRYADAVEIGAFNEPNVAEIIHQSGNQFIDIGNGKMQMLIPLVEQYAYAGYLSGWSDEEYIGDLPRFSIIVDKQHRGAYKAFNVRGDSMDDNTKSAISAGEVVVGRLINKQYWTSKLHLNQWQDYIIVHETGIIVKRIIAHDVENGIITCLSLNPDKNLYPNLSINLSEVYELYNIIQVVRNR